MDLGWSPKEELLRECGMPLLEFGGIYEQRLASSSHLELAVWPELPRVVSWGSSVWRGQQITDASCRPGRLLGGNHWVFLKELPCMWRLPARCGTPAERGCGWATGRSWERQARGPLACLSGMEDPETRSHWRELAIGLQQVFYRSVDHRQIDRHFLFLFLPFASFHSLAPHTFLSAGLRGRVSH